jgi:hypothetical protein
MSQKGRLYSYLWWETVRNELFTVGICQQLARPGQARLTQGHTSPLGLISGGRFIFISQIVCGEIGALRAPIELEFELAL